MSRGARAERRGQLPEQVARAGADRVDRRHGTALARKPLGGHAQHKRLADAALAQQHAEPPASVDQVLEPGERFVVAGAGIKSVGVEHGAKRRFGELPMVELHGSRSCESVRGECRRCAFVIIGSSAGVA